jgi:glycosyltransferase involved in cell wall biosynthesis
MGTSAIGAIADTGAGVRRRSGLLIFNIKTDANDDVLGFTTDWVNAIAAHWDKVFVITMAAGTIDVAGNVRVFSLGQERNYSRLRRALRFYALLARLLVTEQIDACFAHMTPLFAVMAWPLLRPLRIPILLWYAHRAQPPMLKVAHRLVDRVVTSHSNGFTLASGKAYVIGQGVTESKFPLRSPRVSSASFVLLSIARISAIKHIDTMILAVARLVARHGRNSVRLVLLGDALTPADEDYKRNLLRVVAENDLADNVVFAGAVPHAQVPNWLQQTDLTINLAPTGAPDKAGLESLATGIPLLFVNASYRDVLAAAGVNPARYCVPNLTPDSLAEAIEYWMQADEVTVRSELERISAMVHNDHGLSRLSSRICEHIDQLVACRRTPP